MKAKRLTHFDRGGKAHVVEVGEKPETQRVAVASGFVAMAATTLARVREGTAAKGDVLGVARVAALAGLKQTSALIPLCHPVRVTGAEVELTPDARRGGVAITATVRAFDRTGVEMEALTAVSVAALTVYDMLKAVDRGMTIDAVRLDEKRGGRSGTYRRAL